MSVSQLSISQKNYSTRGLLILLVVLGHTLTKNPVFVGKHFIYLFIYTFHMPLFLILSGYYGYSVIYKKNSDIIISIVKSLVIPYIFISYSYIVVSKILFDTGLRLNIVENPTFAMWFILALIFYRLTTKLVVKIPYYLVFLFLIALICDYFPSQLLDVADFHRIFTFMPYYFIGLKIREKDINLQKLKLSPMRLILGVGLSVIVIIFLANNYYKFTAEFLRQTDIDFFLQIPFLNNMLYKIVAICLAILNSTIIYTLVQPSKVFSYMGVKSIYIYLGHVFFILCLKLDIYKEFMEVKQDVFIVLIIIFEVISIIGTILLLEDLYNLIIWKFKIKVSQRQ